MAFEDSGQQVDSYTVNRRSVFVESLARAHQDAAALRRRSYYIYAVTGAAFGLIGLTLFLKPEESLARTIVEGSFSLIEIVAVTYLGANVIDRTRLVDRFSRIPGRGNPQPLDISPDKMSRAPAPPSAFSNVYGGPPPELGSPYQ